MTTSAAIALGLSAAAMLLTSSAAPKAAELAALQLAGRGVQIYICKAQGPVWAWTLAGPEADLFDQDGRNVAHHFAGPTWRAMDGGTLVGEALSSSPSPAPGAVPWLVLRVKAAVGSGLFADVGYITRTLTQGGVAPKGGCDPAHLDQEIRSPYSAVYTFFRQKPAADR